jgi:hypothetical protein
MAIFEEGLQEHLEGFQYHPRVIFPSILEKDQFYEKAEGDFLSNNLKKMVKKAGDRGLPQVCLVPSHSNLYPESVGFDPDNEVRKHLYHLMVLPASSSATSGEGVKGGIHPSMHPSIIHAVMHPSFMVSCIHH